MRRTGGVLPRDSTSAQDGAKWSTSRSGRFSNEEKDFDTHCIGGWLSPSVGLAVLEKRTGSAGIRKQIIQPSRP
jgi:hypothetical protein